MRELIYTTLELEKEYKNRNCEFCSNCNMGHTATKPDKVNIGITKDFGDQ